MRLINAHTLRLEDFTNRKAPPYAVLSHTWGDSEITFLELSREEPDSNDARWAKITWTCNLAREEKLDYAWVDTCCIDKSSSAELTESINSMYRWYEEAQVCVVYLSDLSDGNNFAANLGKCRWSTRGWTLQETIAPKVVHFYDKLWRFCGSKEEHAAHIAGQLRLPLEVLTGTMPTTEYAIAQRMSWAAGRCTTREEDTAYCLLGIFDVSMPLIYGEGKKAFRRLQQAIIAQSNDLTILAWRRTSTDEPADIAQSGGLGLLATSPKDFAGSVNVRPARSDFLEFAVTNKGLLVRGDMVLGVVQHGQRSKYAFRLGWRGQSSLAGEFKIGLRRIGPDMFCRDHEIHEGIPWMDQTFFHLEEFYILEALPSSPTVKSQMLSYRRFTIHVPPDMRGFRLVDVRPRRPWDCQDSLFLRPKGDRGNGFPNVLALRLEGKPCSCDRHYASCIVLCDFQRDNPTIRIFEGWEGSRLMKLAFGDSTRQDSLPWEEIQRQLPELRGNGAFFAVLLHGQGVTLWPELHMKSLALGDESGDSDRLGVLSLSIRMEPHDKDWTMPCGLAITGETGRLLDGGMENS